MNHTVLRGNICSHHSGIIDLDASCRDVCRDSLALNGFDHLVVGDVFGKHTACNDVVCQQLLQCLHILWIE